MDYLGPAGEDPPLSEFHLKGLGQVPPHTIIWVEDKDGKTRKWSVQAESLKNRLEESDLGWNEGTLTQDLNRKTLFQDIFGAKYGEHWLQHFVFIDPGDLFEGENFIDPTILSGKNPGDRHFELCEVLYSTSVKSSIDEEQGGFAIPISNDSLKVKPLMLCVSRTKSGTPFYVIGEHTETVAEPPLQYAYKFKEHFKLWIAVEKKFLNDFFKDLQNIYTQQNPAKPRPVTIEILRYREDLE
jgi:hypothetical protein